MSKSASIFIDTGRVDFAQYEEFIRLLWQEGWSVDKNGLVSYMVDDTFDWQTAPIEHYSVVIKQVENSIRNKLAACIDLVWKDGISSIGLNFSDRSTVLVSISDSIVLLDEINIVDFSWYLSKMSLMLSSVAMTRLQCVYD